MYDPAASASAMNSDLDNDPLGKPANPMQGGSAAISGGGDAPF